MTEAMAGHRVLVTRAAHQAGKLSEALRAVGAEPIEVPVLEIQPPASYDALDQALSHLYSYDWLIVTSANTVRAMVERCVALKVRLDATMHVAAIGLGTAEAARSAGLKVTLTPEHYIAEDLVIAMGDRVRGKRVLLARAAIARDVIPEALRRAGATLNVVDAYQNGVPAAAPEQLRKAMAAGVAAVTFTSSSSATHLAEVARMAGMRFPFEGVHGISIGPVTSQTLRELGWPPAAEAETHDIPGLVEAMKRALQG